MRVEAPPGRYRIIERDRRLVTIDTLTGGEIGPIASQPASSDLLGGVRGSILSVPAVAEQGSRPSALDPPQARPRAGLESATPEIGRLALSPQKANKIVILVTGFVVLAVILILTSLWPFAIVALVLKPSREFLWARIKPALNRYLADDSAGRS